MLIPASAPLSACHPVTLTSHPLPLPPTPSSFPRVRILLCSVSLSDISHSFVLLSPLFPFTIFLHSPNESDYTMFVLLWLTYFIQHNTLIQGILKIVKRIIGERRENEWKVSERVTEHERLLTLGNEQGVVEREVGRGWGWLGDRHWGGHLMGWALGVILYVGKLNTNKK